MSEEHPKIITSFGRRLEIDTALRELAQATSEAELRRQAAAIVESYGNEVVSTLLALLDTTNPQLRGGLGQVAALLQPDEIVPALRRVAYNRAFSDQARIGAITLLQRFLGVEPDPAMVAGMGDPEAIALQSLNEVLLEYQHNPAILLEYLEQLAQEPVDVLLSMIRATQRLEGSRAVPLLRMWVQDPHPPAAELALQILGEIVDPSAVKALHGLLPNLGPQARPVAERSLQKLRLRGAWTEVLQPPDQAICLAGPPQGNGLQVLLFEVPDKEHDAMGVLLAQVHDETGIVEAGGRYATPGDEQLSEQMQALGFGPMPWRQMPFDYGRRQMQAAVSRMAELGTPLPLAFRLFSELLWRWTSPQAAKPLLPVMARDRQEAVTLLAHPAIATWFWSSPGVQRSAENFVLGLEEPSAQQVDRLVSRVLSAELSTNPRLVSLVQGRLLALREWLALSGEPATADRVAAVAATLQEEPESHPLLLHMVRLGLQVSMLGR